MPQGLPRKRDAGKKGGLAAWLADGKGIALLGGLAEHRKLLALKAGGKILHLNLARRERKPLGGGEAIADHAQIDHVVNVAAKVDVRWADRGAVDEVGLLQRVTQACKGQKKAGIAILISDKIDFEIKTVKRDKERTLHNDQRINPRRRYNNYKYICTQHRSTSIFKANANKYERGN